MSRFHQFQALVLLSFLYLLFEVEALSMSFQFSFAAICSGCNGYTVTRGYH
ncbi:hypothetical protein [Coleofasciculus sp. A1-SPW-01]|uniref:hypothetical protein n=1 Tax=Coleofasciculus sp. A1-SPW-01 TaxID=3070819 RepID=UPI0040635E1A